MKTVEEVQYVPVAYPTEEPFEVELLRQPVKSSIDRHFAVVPAWHALDLEQQNKKLKAELEKAQYALDNIGKELDKVKKDCTNTSFARLMCVNHSYLCESLCYIANLYWEFKRTKV